MKMVYALFMPRWLLDEHAITLATWSLVLVTFLLVIATLILWFDSWKKGQEQRERWKREDQQYALDREEERQRWKREDEIRADGLRPKFVFGIDFQGPALGIHVWCTNLGDTNFQVESLAVQKLKLFKETDEAELANVSFPQCVVPPGEKVRMPFPPNFFRRNWLDVDIELSLSVTTASRQFKSDRQPYWFALEQTTVLSMKSGFWSAQSVPCSRCHGRGILYPNGVDSRDGLVALFRSAESQLAATCPQHSSEWLKYFITAEGRSEELIANA